MRHGRHNSGVPAPIDLASVSDVQPFPEDDAARMAADPANASRARSVVPQYAARLRPSGARSGRHSTSAPNC